MRTFLALLLLSATSLGAEKYPSELLADLTKRPWSGENYPALPGISTPLAEATGNEMAHSKVVRQAISHLNPNNSNNAWFAAEEVLEREHAVWCLQACLCHPHDDVQINALRALGRLKDSKAVPFLLIYAEYEAVFVPGSESATLHGIIHDEIAATLSTLTGVAISIKGQDPEGLAKAIREWRKWLVEHPPTNGG